jgi:hypothetical protein
MSSYSGSRGLSGKLFIVVPESYQESSATEAAERSIAATLPEIPGLLPSLSAGERLSVIGVAVTVSRVAFIAAYGDPFGCEPESKSDKAGGEKAANSSVTTKPSRAVAAA